MLSHEKIVEEIDHIKGFFPWHFDVNNEILPTNQAEEPVNVEDVGSAPKEVNFNIKTGLWEYLALTSHKPKLVMEEDLKMHTEIQNKFATSGKIDQETGLRIYPLNTRHKDEEGNERKCNCGGVYNPGHGFEEK